MEPFARGGFKGVISCLKPDGSSLTVIEVIAIVESDVTTVCHLTMHRHAVGCRSLSANRANQLVCLFSWVLYAHDSFATWKVGAKMVARRVDAKPDEAIP